MDVNEYTNHTCLGKEACTEHIRCNSFVHIFHKEKVARKITTKTARVTWPVHE